MGSDLNGFPYLSVPEVVLAADDFDIVHTDVVVLYLRVFPYCIKGGSGSGVFFYSGFFLSIPSCI